MLILGVKVPIVDKGIEKTKTLAKKTVDTSVKIVTDPTHAPRTIGTAAEKTLEETGKGVVKTAEVGGEVLHDAVKEGSDVVKTVVIDPSLKVLQASGQIIIQGTKKTGELAQGVTEDVVKEAKKVNQDIIKLEKQVLSDVTKPITKNVKALKIIDTLIERSIAVQGAVTNGGLTVLNPKEVYKVGTYKTIYDGVKKEAIATVRDLNDLNNKMIGELSEHVISKVSSDLDKWANKYIEYSDKAVDITDAVTEFNNVVKVALTYVGTQFGGPAGAALANVICDKFILKKSMSEKDILKSIAIGMVSGYGAEYVGSLSGAQYEQFASSVTKQVVKGLAEKELHNKSFTSKDFIEAILTSAANIDANSIAAQAANAAKNNIIGQALDHKGIDLGQVVESAMQGVADGQVSNVVNSAVDTALADVPEEYKRMDRRIAEKMVVFFVSMTELTDGMKEINEGKTKNLIDSLPENQALVDQMNAANPNDPISFKIWMDQNSGIFTLCEECSGDGLVVNTFDFYKPDDNNFSAKQFLMDLKQDTRKYAKSYEKEKSSRITYEELMNMEYYEREAYVKKEMQKEIDKFLLTDQFAYLGEKPMPTGPVLKQAPQPGETDLEKAQRIYKDYINVKPENKIKYFHEHPELTEIMGLETGAVEDVYPSEMVLLVYEGALLTAKVGKMAIRGAIAAEEAIVVGSETVFKNTLKNRRQILMSAVEPKGNGTNVAQKLKKHMSTTTTSKARYPERWGEIAGKQTETAQTKHGIKHINEIVNGEGEWKYVQKAGNKTVYKEKFLADGRGIRVKLDKKTSKFGTSTTDEKYKFETFLDIEARDAEHWKFLDPKTGKVIEEQLPLTK